MPKTRRPRVLIVNCYFPETREPLQLKNEMPMPLAPVHLAGWFAADRCDIRLHNEVSHGFLELFRPEWLSWPDLIVFCGLTPAFDRMLHISAYARTRNPKVITVAGGLAIRSLRRYASRFFDYTTTGDVEDIRGIIREALGPEYVAETMHPRYDLADWLGPWIGYVESSRNCNFRCSFCTLTADGRPYQVHGPEFLRQQIAALGRRRLIHIADNQFAGPDRQSFRDRVAVLKEMRAAGHFQYWAGFVTDAFMWDDENLQLAQESGCISLLIGVESFDEIWLRKMNKAQNVRQSQVDLIRRCLEAGILFQYGLVYDATSRTVEEMHRELLAIADEPAIPAPNFIFSAIPFPGTPLFHEVWDQGLILPGTKIRDLEGSTLSLKPLDDVDTAAGFLRNGKNLRGHRAPFVRHQLRMLRRYRTHLSATQKAVSWLTLGSIMSPQALSNTRYLLKRRRQRTHVSTTDRLDVVYTPRFPVDPQYEGYFQPTQVTNMAGHLNETIVEDLLDTRYRRQAAI
jgi:radical SAM superfamily enzyme YgiQ (UPF0313 family)